MKGNLQEALKLFINCKKIDPTNAAVSYELGTIYKLLGVNDLALTNAKHCAESDPKNEWYQLLLVECYNTQRLYAPAVKVREALVKNFPEKAEFKEDLAIQYSIIGQYDKAFKIYEDLEKNYGINEQISLNKVKLLKEQKKTKAMEEELLKLLASNKNETRFYSYLAEFYIDTHEMEKAKAMYDQILVLEPNNPTVNLALHDYYSAQNKPKEAFIHLKKAFENPELDAVTKASIANTFYKRAIEYNDARSLEDGLELAKIMLKVHPKAPETNGVYADFLSLDKNYKEAATYYYMAATASKSDFQTWNKLIVIDYELQAFDSLEHHSSRAIELFPSQASNYLYNGIANMQLKNYKKAVQSFNDGLEFVNDNKSMMLDFYRSLGDANYYLKDYPKSDKAFEDALKIDSDNTYVLNNYAYFLSLRNENLEKAEKLSKKTIELRPNDRNYMDTYGWILYQQKKYKLAEEWLGNASKLGPKNPNILEHYGDVLYKLNKPEEALIQWNAAKKAGGNSDSLLQKIKDKRLND
jgi:tetratricopeptide (TPR) repeat protein